MKKLSTLLTITLVLFVMGVNAQVIVKDINPLTNSSTPLSLVNINGVVYFAADDGTNGKELWKSDGTTTGTVIVKDINPSGSSSPVCLTNVNGTLFFNANDGTNGKELWKSDGTAAGTVMVKNINSGSDPQSLINLNGTLIFVAMDSNTTPNYYHLWKSDGTSAGTIKVKNINFGSAGYYSGCETVPGGCQNFTVANGVLFFAMGSQLWKSDGTTNGTIMVKDINPAGNLSSCIIPVSSNTYIDNLTDLNGTLFFTGDDGTNGNELWKSDGTSSGTVMVKDIYTTGCPSRPDYLTNVNGTLFFSAYDGEGNTHNRLWKSDGTLSGTVMLYNGNTTPYGLVNGNGTLFFIANDGANNTLWKSNGTVAGTVKINDITPIDIGTQKGITYVDGEVFFSANDGIYGAELWKSDGTTAGTVMVNDIKPGSSGSIPNYFLDVNGTLFFTADDGVHGVELWKYSIGSGIYSSTLNENFNIYPIPSSDIVTIENNSLNKDRTISIYNIQGQMILNQTLQQTKTEVDISKLTKGVYVLKIESKEGVVVKRLIKE